jgi:hypothetical protein
MEIAASSMSDPSKRELGLRFRCRGESGTITVRVWPNSDPAAVGAGEHAQGFPICEATVSTELSGYNALLGWVQLVGTQEDSAIVRRFEPDPLQIFADLDTPFGFYGVHPTLFDAPSRRDRHRSLDWLAHSFLCGSPTQPMDRVVEPLTAFQWGFRLIGGNIEIVYPTALDVATWKSHVGVLASAYPRWRFESDYGKGLL